MSLIKQKKIFIITFNHSTAGFFAYVTFALNQLAYCEKHHYLPVVYFGRYSGDGRNAFYDENYGDNTWDYYFEPVAHYCYADIQNMLQDPQSEINHENIVQLSSDELWYLHQQCPESVYNYPYGYYKDKYIFDESWYQHQRQKAREYLQRYVRVKPHIIEKVENFSKQYWQKPVLGIHIRGTDKGTARSYPSLMRVVPPQQYFPYIDEYISKNPGCKIFIATDQKQFIDIIKSKYQQRVISYDAIRSTSLRNTFQKQDGNYYTKGEDVLIDCLLLSKCDFLLKCTSAVGEYALYFNPQLRCIDLNHTQDNLSFAARTSVFLRLAKIRLFFKLIALYNLIFNRKKL